MLIGLLTHGTYAGTGDEPHYVAMAHSAAFDFDFDLANNYGAAEPLIAGGGLDAGPHVRAGRDGILRPVHDVGLPLLLAPAARVLVPAVRFAARRAPPDLLRRLRVTPSVMYRHTLSLCMIALAVWLASLLFDTLAEIGAHPRAAFAATLVTALSPPLLIYSILTFTEVLSALLCLLAFRRIALEDRDLTPARLQVSAGSGFEYWFIAGAATGLLLLVHLRNAGLVLGLTALALAAIYRTRAWGDLSGFAAGLALPVAVRTAVTYHFWGTLVTTPHGRVGEWTGAGGMLREAGIRLAGLFFDQEYGLIIYAPVFVLAICGLAVMPRRLATRVLVVSGGYLALVIWPGINVHGWTGQWCPAARMMVPIVPLLALPLLAGMRAVPRPLVAITIAAQLAINAYLWQNPKNLWNDGDGVAAVCARGSWQLCEYLPSLARDGR